MPVKRPKVKPLPDDPSALIRVALRDLKKAENDRRYKIDMGEWHRPNHRCRVCFAGSVMAFSLGVDPHSMMEPYNFESSTQDKLEALNYFRENDWRNGLTRIKPELNLGYVTEDDNPILSKLPTIPPYAPRGKANEAFHKAFAKAAKILKKAGL